MRQVLSFLLLLIASEGIAQSPDYGILERGYQMQNENSWRFHQMMVEEGERDYKRKMDLLKLKKAEKERDERAAKEKARNDMRAYKGYYNSISNYPETVKDGWHTVIAMDNADFCAERKVYVSNNTVKHYVVNDWSFRTVETSYPITDGKGLIRINTSNGTSSTLEILFLNFIVNPNTTASPPVQAGKVSFWVDFKYSTDVELYFGGMYVGKFDTYFPASNPSCGQKGTLTVTWKPGVYKYYAESKTSKWSGTVTISEDGCSLQGLTK